MKKYTSDEVQEVTRILEAIIADRTAISDVEHGTRVALIQAAGRLSRPTRDEQRKAARSIRKLERRKGQDHDRAVRSGAQIRLARESPVYSAPPRLVAASGAEAGHETEELRTPRACYVCKAEFTRVHFFYDSMCASCAALNYEKRFQTASLAGRIALITGARIKIGYQAALMMLRAGAHVIVTTRFPRDAASRYAREEDFATWKDRLEIHGLDLRHSPSVEIFARYLSLTKPHLDILVNNAAQTVRRPPAFYAHMLELERLALADLPADVQGLLAGHEACKRAVAVDAPELEASQGFVAWRGEGPAVGIRASAELAQIPCAFDDPEGDRALFPVGRVDADLQQVDLRAMNSWRMALADVPSAEMLEVQLVNAVAPFILCAKLKGLMLRKPGPARHIVNVSAMEGQFGRFNKTDKHPHTNMAKAALNMLTLTSARDYAADNIFMNAVDTGWVTDEDPAALSQRKQEAHDFHPPLDIVDGAARIMDPVFSHILTGRAVWGKFLKDYSESPW